jgi:glycosyltransferase involved in cell wall biosynthesis
MGLAPNIRFIGTVDSTGLPDWYRAADLTVLSSHSEGIPNVLRESLACGTPYVATRVGGIAELCSDPAIRLVQPGNSPALAMAIEEGLSSKSRIEGFTASSWQSCASQLLGHLDRVGTMPDEQLGAFVRRINHD